MATPTDPPADPAGRSSDQQWLDRLGGLPGPYTDTEAVQEADALRLAIQLEEQALETDPALKAATSEAGIDELWQRLESLRPIAPPPPAAAPRGRWQGGRGAIDWLRDAFRGSAGASTWPRWPATAGVAAVLALSAVLVLQRPADEPYGDGPVPQLRGGAAVLQRQVVQPQLAAEAFANALRAAGLKPGLYRRNKTTYVVDINLDATELVEAAEAFSLIALPPATGFTRVEFVGP